MRRDTHLAGQPVICGAGQADRTVRCPGEPTGRWGSRGRHGSWLRASWGCDQLTGCGIYYGSALTQADGTFHAFLAAAPGPVEVGIAFAGTRSLDRAEPLTVTTDPAKQQIELPPGGHLESASGASQRLTRKTSSALKLVSAAMTAAAASACMLSASAPTARAAIRA